MIQGVSVADYLIGLAILLLVWYGGVVLFLSQEKNKRFPGSKVDDCAEPLPDLRSGASLSSNLFVLPGEDLMGEPRLPEGMSVVGMDEIGFVGEESVADKENHLEQVGLVPDLLEEIKEVFLVLADEDGTKNDFLRLMKVVRETYPGMASHPRIRAVNAFISAHASFHISAEELENLWV